MSVTVYYTYRKYVDRFTKEISFRGLVYIVKVLGYDDGQSLTFKRFSKQLYTTPSGALANALQEGTEIRQRLLRSQVMGRLVHLKQEDPDSVFSGDRMGV